VTASFQSLPVSSLSSLPTAPPLLCLLLLPPPPYRWGSSLYHHCIHLLNGILVLLYPSLLWWINQLFLLIHCSIYQTHTVFSSFCISSFLVLYTPVHPLAFIAADRCLQLQIMTYAWKWMIELGYEIFVYPVCCA
jgi:hypothetical protein